MQIVDDKSSYNKRYNENHKPFPVRLGVLKEIVQEQAFDVESSLHGCLVKALEVQYLPQLIERSKKVNISEVIELLEIGVELFKALRELNIPETLFYLSVPEDKVNYICRLVTPKQVDLLRQKVGYYNHIRENTAQVPCSPVKVVKMKFKRFVKDEKQLAFFY